MFIRKLLNCNVAQRWIVDWEKEVFMKTTNHLFSENGVWITRSKMVDQKGVITKAKGKSVVVDYSVHRADASDYGINNDAGKPGLNNDRNFL